MKKYLLLLLSIVITFGFCVNVYAGEYSENEQYIIEQISGESFSANVGQEFINQLKNYFYQDDVNIEKSDAEDFVIYLEDALVEQEESGDFVVENSSLYQNFQKAGTAIGLLLEYDSQVNDFYGIDEDGYIVLDFQDIIKDTDSSFENNWNFSIEEIFAIIIIICILGIVINLRRWNEKLKRRSKKNYEDDDEDEDELEVANRRTRNARLQTLSYQSVKQILRYFYVPIIMGLIVIGVGFVVINSYSDIIDSVNTNFVNTQPLYVRDDTEFTPATEKSNKGDTVQLSDIRWPRYGEQYGVLQCDDLDIDTPVYFGDRGELLNQGAGQYVGSLLPGQGGTILIGAHDTTYFAGLEDVKKGDSFTFTTSYGIYTYEVTDIMIYDEDKYDQAYGLASKAEQLVLYTCYPFGELNGAKTERMFVYLDRTSGPDIEY